MLRLILWRLVQLPLLLAIIFTVTFALVWIVPGNPLTPDSGPRPPAEVVQAMRHRYNLDNPWAFAGSYLDRLLLHGDFGPSLRHTDQSVNDILAQGLPVSIELGLAAMVVALLLGTAAGIAGALWPGSALDFSSLAVALAGISLPNFVTGSVLLAVFAGLLHWLPVGGWNGWGDDWQKIILPAITLGIMPAAYIARLIRLGLADVMSSDFIRTARAKGVSRSGTLFRHALKVAYLPVLSFLGPAAAAAMTGSFVVEKVFNINGIGQLFVDGVLGNDKAVVLGVVLVYATMLVLLNLLVDVAYAWLDPRIDV